MILVVVYSIDCFTVEEKYCDFNCIYIQKEKTLSTVFYVLHL